MLYLFHGNDLQKTRVQAFAWIAAARTKEPNLAYARLAREELTDAALEDAAASGGLFVKRLLVLLDDPFAAVKAKESEEDTGEDEGASAKGGVLDTHLEALAASDNAIVILAPGLTAVRAKKLAPLVKKEYVFDAPAARVSARGFNSALVNALGAKDTDVLWLEVVRAFKAGDAPEMVHGLLHWKARDLAEKGNRAWRPADARRLSFDLIVLLQESRRKNLDLSRELERWALSVSK